MTTPAHEAPLVFPSVAFRPVRLAIVCVALTALAVLATGFIGSIGYGFFFGLGLAIGLVNALMVRHAVESITAQEHPLKKKMAVNSAMRLLVISVVALLTAYFFKHIGGIGVLFGLAIFQALLVMSTSIPVLRRIRANGLDVLDTESKG